MKSRFAAFNTYLLAAILLCSCKSSEERKEAANARKEKKEVSTVRFHLEARGDTTERSETVPILRASPIPVKIVKESFLDERDVLKASIIDAVGGFSIVIQFDKHGTFVLDAISTANKGKRIAIMTEAGDRRWLAAPVIPQRITDGVLTFTPDATREEAIRIVRGLNNLSAKIRKKRLIPEY